MKKLTFPQPYEISTNLRYVYALVYMETERQDLTEGLALLTQQVWECAGHMISA